MSSNMTIPVAKQKNESQRLKELQALMVLDTAPETLFDGIAKLAADICGTPIALISFIDKDRQWFESNIGIEGATEINRAIAFCSQTILQEQFFEVSDALSDKRFKNNPFVTKAPNIHFYAGAPITLPTGENIGTICVIDQKINKLNAHQKTILKRLGDIVSQVLVNREQLMHELECNADILATIVSSSSDAIISKSIDGFITSWNKGAEAAFGYSAKEIIGRPILCLFPKGREQEEVGFVVKIKNGALIEHFDTQRITKSGALIDVSVNLSPIKNVSGEIAAIAIIARDITAEKKIKKELAYQHEHLRVTMQSIGDAVITVDLNGTVEYLNPVAESLTGWKLAEAKGVPVDTVFNIINEATRKPCINPVSICINERIPAGLAHNTVLISKSGKEYGIEDSANPIRDKKNNIFGAVLVFHDATAQRKMALEMAYRATHDTLTGLFNRSEFEGKLKLSLAKSQEHNCEHALMVLGLDQFKVINDTCGHATGDRLLKEISHNIRSQLHTSDTLCRLGGDEFAILLEECQLEVAMQVAEKICKSVEAYRISHNEKRFSVSASIGLLIFNQKWKSIEQLMQSADATCYAAKESGRNRVHLYYDADFSLEAKRGESYWASRITQALEEDNFILYCQRIIPLTSNHGLKCEVLLRMIDEHGAMVGPNTFLPAAEKFHLISRIDKWVINNTFNWLKDHSELLTHIDSLAINISGQSISDHNFHQYTLDLINSLSLDCSKVCFEITETAAITNVDEATQFINSMKRHYIRFSLDDFGSGVSSFGYLKSLPVDFLKIDGQFIQNLSDNVIDQAIVRCIVEVAKSTNKLTIAEWVETEEVEALLKTMGVDYIQGFLRHKPAPLDYLLKSSCSYVH
ncbi:MAG: diguanylate cyclase (GGDEF)-like protein/PAS domain S-box-containing protein [Methylophilaceae bacterium]|jgi:diguanylate cyclase (GGDEF)-like protein/PAS domain S-box-containing protein